MSRAAPSLIALVMRRIMAFSALAMAAQLAGVFIEYWSDTPNLGRLAIERETAALAEGLSHDGEVWRYNLPASRRDRYAPGATGYFLRALDPAGNVLFSNCDGFCERFFPTRETRRLDFWMMAQRPGKPLNISGGRAGSDAANAPTIDVAIVNDPDGVIYAVLANEIQDHMALPMSLMLVVVLGATGLSIAQALRPVRASAALAARLDPLAPAARLPVAGMPREIADYARAVNGALERIFALMRSQKIMTSAISHELRTPLAIVRLELEKIEDVRARKIEQDLEALNHLVEQLTTLARLEGAGLDAPQQLDPADIAEEVVAAMAPLAFQAGRSIAFESRDPAPFRGHRALIENALRNLVDNAIRHSGAGAAIVVAAGPGPRLVVSDDGGAGPALWDAPGDGGFGAQGSGLGLKIIARIAEIHGGAFAMSATPPRGARAELKFSPDPPA